MQSLIFKKILLSIFQPFVEEGRIGLGIYCCVQICLRLMYSGLFSLSLSLAQSGSFGTMPNLRRLALRLGAGGADGTDDAAVADLPLWRLLDANAALSVLRLQISLDLVQKKEVTSVAHSGAAAGGAGGADGGAGGVLRHTLQGNLPIRLAEITLEGEEIANVHPAAFKVCPLTPRTTRSRPTKMSLYDPHFSSTCAAAVFFSVSRP